MSKQTAEPMNITQRILAARREMPGFIEKDKVMQVRGQKPRKYVSIDRMLEHVRGHLDKFGLDVCMPEKSFDVVVIYPGPHCVETQHNSLKMRSVAPAHNLGHKRQWATYETAIL